MAIHFTHPLEEKFIKANSKYSIFKNAQENCLNYQAII